MRVVVTVAVTGGAGHVGSNLVASLRASGDTVRVIDLVRPAAALQCGAHWIRADVRDEAAMRAALDGADIVYHLAAVISIVGGQGGRVESVNVGGVGATSRAALAIGVRRFVHCSSVHAFDVAASAGQPVYEGSARAVRADLPAYDRSKAGGEVELGRAARNGLDTVTVNPTAVIGPVDEAPSRMGAVLRAMWRGRLPALTEGGFDWVDVRDVVGALRAAAQRGRTGEGYLVPGHRLSILDLAGLAADAANRPAIRRTIPSWSVRAVAPAGTVLCRLTGSPLLPTVEAWHALASFPVVDGRKAADELGYRARPITETLSDLYRWFAEQGRLGRTALSSSNPGR
jgi:dihydroflavonol-4-reductase